RDLLAAWLGQDPLAEERQEALLARLHNDPAFRQAFIDEIHLLGMLKVVQSSEPRWLRLEDELGWSAQERASGGSLSDRVLEAARPRSRWRSTGRRLLALAAVVLIAVGGYVVFQPGPASNPAPDPPSNRFLELATAVKLDGVEWAPEEGLQPTEGS